MSKIVTLVGLALPLLAVVAKAQVATGHAPSPSARPSVQVGSHLADPDLDHVPGELLVKFRPGVPVAAITAFRRSIEAVELEALPRSGMRRWRLPPGLDAEGAAALIRVAVGPAIEYAEPNYILHALVGPDDPRKGELWGMHNVGQTGGTADADIDALEAWQVQTGSSSVVVGVIDSGIDYLHPDLAANIWVNQVEATGIAGQDDDGNGYIDDVRGWDFVNDDNDPMDDHGHGTHVAGTIGGIGNNGIGIAGVCWNVRLMPLKFLGAGGSGTTADAIEAIEYAAAMGVPITNNSWGGGRRSNALENAIELSGGLFVAAAGNSGSSRKMYPAGYAANNILSIAATNHNDALAGFSNFGSDWVDVGAPGVGILSTLPGEGYGRKSGTSMAAPHAAGVAALILAQFPAFGVADVKNHIIATVDSLPALAGATLSGGRINARAAVGAGELPPDSVAPAAVGDLAVAAVAMVDVSLAWTASGDDGGVGTAYLYDLRYRVDGPVTAANWATSTPVSGVPAPAPSGMPEAFTVGGLPPDTTVHFGLVVMDELGNLSTVSNSPSATTENTGWAVEIVASGPNGLGTYNELAHDPGGLPAIAYGSEGQVILARHDGSGWGQEVVADDGAGTSLAFDGNGNPTISHGWGKLYFDQSSGSSWSTTTLERSRAYNDVTSLRYHNGDPMISYRTDSGLKVARRSGSAWTTEFVDPGAGARYSALAFDQSGNPAIAYSDDIDGDNQLDTLKLARWNGAAWEVEIVDTGTAGYGVFAAIAFDPTTGEPSVVHRGAGQVRFLRKSGSTWLLESPDSTTQYVFGCSIAYAADGTAYVAYADGFELRFALRDPGSGAWTVEVVDLESGLPFSISLQLGPGGIPAMSYEGSGGTLRFARRQSP